MMILDGVTALTTQPEGRLSSSVPHYRLLQFVMNLHQPHGSVFPLAYTSNPLIEILQMLQELWTVLSWLLAAITSFYSQLFRRPRGEQRIPALPVEVCEPTTDFINISFVRFSSASDKARRDTLLACALTCRA